MAFLLFREPVFARSLTGALLAALLPVIGCARNPPAPAANVASVSVTAPANAPTAPAKPAAAEVPIYTYEIVNVLPHAPDAFTQGLVYLDGQFLESTGLKGQSSLRRVDPATGKVLQRVDVAKEFFAEGLAVLGDEAFQLTWENHRGFVYDRTSFRLKREFTYATEGWGLTTDGQSLIMSDGTDQLQFLDPVTFEVKRTVRAYLVDHPVEHLNELEYVKGEIFANVWGANYLVRIDPASGRVTGIIDLSGLLPPEDQSALIDVLNGIAYDAAGDRLFVTGKRWPKVFEVRLKRK